MLRDGANALGRRLDAPVDADAVAVGKRHEVEGVVGNQLETVPVEPEVPVDRLLREPEQLDCPRVERELRKLRNLRFAGAAPSEDRSALDDERLRSRGCQVGGAREAVVPSTDDDDA
ncbi:MAG: hypothetical protein OXG37_06780 [Actinomycetia bacterium]|nr:hypothetical protein [Actinomycetes bacterium]